MKVSELTSHLTEATVGDRPAELGDAYFWIDGHLVDVHPYRNHRDWLVSNAERLGLPEYVQDKPVRALWEAYKKGIIRIVWDRGGRWQTGQGKGQGNVLYLNGFPKDVWANMRGIINDEHWVGHINTVVIEYVREVNGKPNWFQTDIFRDGDIESLYRGKKPRRERLPPNAIYGGEPGLAEGVAANKMANIFNDHATATLSEMFDQHFFSTTFFDTFKYHNPRKPLNSPMDSMTRN